VSRLPLLDTDAAEYERISFSAMQTLVARFASKALALVMARATGHTIRDTSSMAGIELDIARGVRVWLARRTVEARVAFHNLDIVVPHTSVVEIDVPYATVPLAVAYGKLRTGNVQHHMRFTVLWQRDMSARLRLRFVKETHAKVLFALTGLAGIDVHRPVLRFAPQGCRSGSLALASRQGEERHHAKQHHKGVSALQRRAGI